MSRSHTYLHSEEVVNVLNKEFANLCGEFVDKKMSIYFDEDKTIFILLSREKDLPELNITYDII